MDLVKVLRSLDELVAEVVLWVVLATTTLSWVVLHPVASMAYVSDEWGKPKEERFQRRMPPVLLWLLVAVLPSYVAAHLGLHASSDESMATFIDKLGGSSIEGRLLATALLIVYLPLGYAVASRRQSGAAPTTDVLRKAFSAQCYPAAVAGTTQAAAMSPALIGNDVTALPVAALYGLALIWYFAVQAKLARRTGHPFRYWFGGIFFGWLISTPMIVAAYAVGRG